MDKTKMLAQSIKSLMSELEKLQDENRRLILELEKSRAEVKRLKAMLAIGYFVIRE